jgi:hypothetical protein
MAIYVLVMFWIMLPSWKREAVLRSLKPHPKMKRGLLTPAEEILVREFRQRVSDWDHDQTSREK